jgi:hypothetical protein
MHIKVFAPRNSRLDGWNSVCFLGLEKNPAELSLLGEVEGEYIGVHGVQLSPMMVEIVLGMVCMI